MTQLITWCNFHRSTIELWIVNGVAASLNLSNIQTILSIGLLILTFGYTAWKFRYEYKRSKTHKK